MLRPYGVHIVNKGICIRIRIVKLTNKSLVTCTNNKDIAERKRGIHDPDEVAPFFDW